MRQVEKISRPYAFIKFDRFIQKTRKLYLDTRTQRNLEKLSEELSEVHSIMTRNIQEVLGQGERLESEYARARARWGMGRGGRRELSGSACATGLTDTGVRGGADRRRFENVLHFDRRVQEVCQASGAAQPAGVDSSLLPPRPPAPAPAPRPATGAFDLPPSPTPPSPTPGPFRP